MSKIRKKTGRICLVCDEPFENNMYLCIHKTRRQSHNLCENCAIGYLMPQLEKVVNNLRQNIDKDDIFLVKCPGSYHSIQRNICKHKIDVRKFHAKNIPELSTELFRIQYVAKNDLAYICRNKGCGAIIEIDPGYGNELKCVACEDSWCRYCNVSPYHTNQTCLEYELEHSNTETGKALKEEVKQGLLKSCPRCRIATYRPSGCNKMHCSSCNVTWCWLCGETGIDYGHFNPKNNTSCKNKLWERTREYEPRPQPNIPPPIPPGIRQNIEGEFILREAPEGVAHGIARPRQNDEPILIADAMNLYFQPPRVIRRRAVIEDIFRRGRHHRIEFMRFQDLRRHHQVILQQINDDIPNLPPEEEMLLNEVD